MGDLFFKQMAICMGPLTTGQGAAVGDVGMLRSAGFFPIISRGTSPSGSLLLSKEQNKIGPLITQPGKFGSVRRDETKTFHT